MKNLTNLELAIIFARRRTNEGMSFDDVSERTASFMYDELGCTLIEAQATAVRAAQIVEAQASAQYLDLSHSTGDMAVIACPATGRKTKVSMRVINHALQCLQNQQNRSAAATA